MADHPARSADDDPLLGTSDADTLDHAAWASYRPPPAFRRGARSSRPLPGGRIPFVAVSPDHDEKVWDDLAALVGPGGVVPLTGGIHATPAGWELIGHGEGVQMIGAGLEVAADPDLIELGLDDVPDMLGLIERTRPGPFLPRTVELGRYLGIRRRGTLVAMAGERLHLPGWTEISAVCTDSNYRGQGLATRLVRAIGAGIKARGETPFLHAVATNTNAIRLYEQLGFVLRRRAIFQALGVPAGEVAG